MTSLEKRKLKDKLSSKNKTEVWSFKGLFQLIVEVLLNSNYKGILR